MAEAAGRPQTTTAPGDATLGWLVSRRRTTALQLEALAPRAAQHHPGRAVALRRRLRALDAAIARSAARSQAAAG